MGRAAHLGGPCFHHICPSQVPSPAPFRRLITPAAPSEPALPFQPRSLSWLLKFNVFNHTPRGFKNQNCPVTSNETLAPLHRASTPMDGRCRNKVWHRPPHHTHTILTFPHLFFYSPTECSGAASSAGPQNLPPPFPTLPLCRIPSLSIVQPSKNGSPVVFTLLLQIAA